MGCALPQTLGLGWHISNSRFSKENATQLPSGVAKMCMLFFSTFATCCLVNGDAWVVLFDGGVESKTLH
jgi:hypothetical protein